MNRVYESLTFQFQIRTMILCGILCFSWNARADHAITQDGKVLFNVMVENTMTTWSRPLKVRYKTSGDSYIYDYGSDVISRPPGKYGDFYWIGDFVTTSKNVLTKEEARDFMRKRGWDRYEPPPSVTIVPFTPAPVTPTPEPTQIIGEGELADASLPIGDRVQQQLEKFIAQQKELAAQIEFAVKVQGFDAKKGKEMRIQLLDRQIKILQQYYTSSENLVQKAMEALQNQRKSVNDKGTFTHETLHGL